MLTSPYLKADFFLDKLTLYSTLTYFLDDSQIDKVNVLILYGASHKSLLEWFS